MSLVFSEGFDHHNSVPSKWNLSNPAATSTQFPRTGARCSAAQATHKHQVLPAQEHATFTIGFNQYRNGSAGESARAEFWSDNGSTQHLSVLVNSAGAIEVRRGGTGGTVLGTSAAGLVPLAQHTYIEVKATLHDTTGSVEVRVNGGSTPVLSLTGIDTKNAGTKAVFDSFAIVTLQNTFADDVYVTNGAGATNTGFLGDIRVETLFPTGPGATTQLTPSTAVANWTTVDEVPPSITDYNGSATDGLYDTYQMTDSNGAPAAQVFGVNVFVHAFKSDVGAKSAATVLRSGGTDYTGADVALSTSGGYLNTLYETDPATSAAWTISGVNAMEAGGKVRP